MIDWLAGRKGVRGGVESAVSGEWGVGGINGICMPKKEWEDERAQLPRQRTCFSGIAVRHQ